MVSTRVWLDSQVDASYSVEDGQDMLACCWLLLNVLPAPSSPQCAPAAVSAHTHIVTCLPRSVHPPDAVCSGFRQLSLSDAKVSSRAKTPLGARSRRHLPGG